MHIDWGRAWDYLYGNRLAIEGGILFVVTSGIKTAPIPTSRWGLWLYDWGHQLFNITNTRLTTQPVQTAPPNVEKPAAAVQEAAEGTTGSGTTVAAAQGAVEGTTESGMAVTAAQSIASAPAGHPTPPLPGLDG